MGRHPLRMPVGREGAQWEAISQLREEVRQLRESRTAAIQRAYAPRGDAFVPSGTAAEVTAAEVHIPSEDSRVLLWASAIMTVVDAGTSITVYFNDSDTSGGTVSDFADEEFPLATFTGTADFLGPSYVAPALPRINLLGLGAIALPNGLNTGNVESGDSSISGALGSGYFPSAILPYNDDPPTPGDHKFRITAKRTATAGSGVAAINNVKLWIMVL